MSPHLFDCPQLFEDRVRRVQLYACVIPVAGFDHFGGFEGAECPLDPALRVTGQFYELGDNRAAMRTDAQEVAGTSGISAGTGGEHGQDSTGDRLGARVPPYDLRGPPQAKHRPPGITGMANHGHSSCLFVCDPGEPVKSTRVPSRFGA